MKIDVVIGANFGDEGKGLTTDYLCRTNDNNIVIRFNGGAQAGHTVQLDSGERHVFKHIGSGTFANTPTYLSHHFIVNPTELLRETVLLNQFASHISDPRIFVHPAAKITTPFDVMFNWAIETKRQFSHSAHGSCGFGIGQTEERHSQGDECIIHAQDLDKPEYLRHQLLHIRDTYYKRIIAENDLESYIDEDFFNDSIVDDFISRCGDVVGVVYVADYSRLQSFDHLVFEGAQGLLLDQEHKWFPHVTRSNTGIKNVIDIVEAFSSRITQPINVHYITRSYLTRHGNGPLPHEVDGVIYPGIVDHTNFTNLFQGHLRFAPFNMQLLRESISADVALSPIPTTTILVITCFNQLPQDIQYVDQYGKLVQGNANQLLSMVDIDNTWDQVLISTTPTASGIAKLKTIKNEPILQ